MPLVGSEDNSAGSSWCSGTSMPDDAELRDAVHRIVSNADLETLTVRMVRKQLEQEFSVSLEGRKQLIKETVMEMMSSMHSTDDPNNTELQENNFNGVLDDLAVPTKQPDEERDSDAEKEEDDEESEDDAEEASSSSRKTKKGKKTAQKRTKGGSGRGGAFNAELSVSPELAAVVGSNMMSRPQIVKKLWEYIHDQQLQDPNDKRTILLDDTLRGVFRRDKVTMFSMNKYVKRHVRKPEDLPPNGWDGIDQDAESSEDESTKQAKKSISASKSGKKRTVVKRKKRAGSDDESDDEDQGGSSRRKSKRSANPNNPFNMQLALSPELAVLMGSDRMARPQIVKKLWEYIHEHNLQDPNDKRTILLDDQLKAVFRKDSFTMFSMNKYVKRHVRKPDELPADGWNSINREAGSSDEEQSKSRKKRKA